MVSGELRSTIIAKLHGRNKQQCQVFKDLIFAHNRLFDSTDSLKAENLHLTVQIEKLRSEHLDVQLKSDGSNGKTNEKVLALEMKLFRLQEELTELHRRKGENAQQLIDLRNSYQDKEKELEIKDSKLRELELTMVTMKEIQKNLEQLILEREETIQMITDEHQALQLAFTGIQEQLRTKQDENRELVERWLRLKAVDADRLNEENEAVLRQDRSKVTKDLSDAVKESQIIDSHGRDSPGPYRIQFVLPSRIHTKFDAHEGEVLAVTWGAKGRLIGTGGADRKVKIWEVVQGGIEPKATLRGSNAAITSVDFDSEENLILGASNDYASRVWTLSDQRLRHTLTGHSGRVMSAKFLGESTKVVSGSHDRTLKTWDLRSLACVKTMFAGSKCHDVVADRAGTTIISAHFDNRIRFWDARCEAPANEVVLQGKVTSLDISPDGCNLLSCVRDDTLKLLDLRMNQVVGTFCSDGFRVAYDWTRAVFSPEGTHVSVGSHDGTLFTWSILDPSKALPLKEHSVAVPALCWQPNGSYLASCDKNKQVIIWTTV